MYSTHVASFMRPLRWLIGFLLLVPFIAPPAVSNAAPQQAPTMRTALLTSASQGVDLGSIEAGSNNTSATATPIAGSNVRLTGTIFPAGDIDYYSFAAAAGDRVYAATMTSASAGSSTDSQLTLLASDGVTTIEFDDDNGSFAGLSSSIAGATIPATGVYYLMVNDFTAGTTTERPYELYFRLQSAGATAEVEPNDTSATATPLPANGWVSGARNPAGASEQDWYSLSLNAGDTVFFSLDLDPERDGVTWNGRLGIALFGDATNQILPIDDAGTGDVSPRPNIPSEALFMTVRNAGTYYAFVDSASAATGGPTATYHLSVSVIPQRVIGVNCTTYTSTNVPQTIGPGAGLTSSTITVPGNPRIADLNVTIVLSHTVMQEIDAQLRSPAGNDNGLFTDIGAAAAGGQRQMEVTFDDQAALVPVFTQLRGLRLKPELNYRLGWFHGINAGGTWTLDLRDDATNANGGTLTSWSLEICEQPPLPASPTGFVQTTVFTTDFESGAAGFTSSGTQNEWELGLPATIATSTANPVAAFNSCNSGVACWKTDLDNTYNATSNQDLLSPNINLAGLSGPITLSWAQRYQIESANFEQAYVEVREVGNPANARRVWQWLDATMTNSPGSPAVNIPASAGWGLYHADISSFAGQTIEVVFHLDSDNVINLGGLAIDDVSVTAQRPAEPDLSVNKTVSPLSANPGQPITYTLSFSNTGLSTVSSVVLTDTIPISVTNLSVVSSGAVITDTGAIPAYVWQVQDLAAGQSGIITITGQIDPGLRVAGVFSNTVTMSGIGDITPANNSATAAVTVITIPEITVVGNGQEIASGDTTPSNADGTDFGDSPLGQPITYTYTISNTGSNDLNLSGTPLVALSGANAADFSVVTDPATPIGPGQSATFQVRFTPSATGARSATVTIANNDGDEGTYTFAILGNGTNVAPIANAGGDQSVGVSTLVTLNGSASSDPDGHTPLAYGWSQTGGPTVSLNNADTASPSFTSPAASSVLTFSLTVTDTYGLADPTPDTVVITVSAAPVSPATNRIYLPLILRNDTTAPDLIVESVSAGSSGITVVIRNIGDGPVVNGFWVDVYLNPRQWPGYNQQWDQIAPGGAVWGVTGAALSQLAPGGTLTLTSGDAYYDRTESSALPFPAGALVFAQVDSVNPQTTYGAVNESNEANNVFGPVTSLAGGLPQASPVPARFAREGLPRR